MPEQIVATQDLGRKFDESWALRSMTFALEEGKLAVIVGPNGAGKTTTIRILTTNLKPSKGKAQILGMDVLTETKRIRKRIAYLPQGYEVNRNLTPYESIKWNLVARGISFSEAGREAKKWIAKMQLDHCKDRTCWTLSGGEKRRVAVATILATNADLIFLDEPTTGLDVEGCYATWKMIREFLRTGTTILLTTHNMKEAETIADEVIFIKNGKSSIQDPLYKLLDKLPEKFRVTVKKNSLGKHSLKRTVDLGDKVVIYARDQEEVREILSKFTDLTSIVSVNQVGLEDAYLYLARAE
jgi:ABC-2 type transport system ATP-binding protein